MSWLFLILAGILEVAWSQSIKPTDNFTRPLPTALCFALAAGAVYLLSRPMNTVAVGPAYVVFTGIGAVGAIGLGIAVHGDLVTPGRLVAAALIVAGIIMARLTAA